MPDEPSSTGEVRTKTRLYTRKTPGSNGNGREVGTHRSRGHAELRVGLAEVEARMLERVRDHYDMPFTILIRLMIREKYSELYDENPEPIGTTIRVGGGAPTK